MGKIPLADNDGNVESRERIDKSRCLKMYLTKKDELFVVRRTSMGYVEFSPKR